ncbi:class II glutamine amidotransferase [Undibacterium sp. WLHG33]|uniref:class II glutamine amidotransferase n=1 Tax=Undibacterium sp. WLHG33 TaxID=3412482 RepID=UPI003C2E01F7
MCELLAMSSSVPERLNLSLQLLASHGDKQHGTNDGWGVAYYQDQDVALFREPQGAGNSRLLEFLRENGPETNIAISHIRRATIGARQLANTQPFVRAMAGRRLCRNKVERTKNVARVRKIKKLNYKTVQLWTKADLWRPNG